MICLIQWNRLNFSEWEDSFAKIPRSTLLQSYDYARAVCALNRQGARWGLVTIDGKNAGLVQILEAGILGNLVHAVILDRGPLWFEGYGDDLHFASFLKEFNQQFPRRLGRRRRFIPEAENTPQVRKQLEVSGFKCVNAQPYKTLWLDLKPDLEALRAGLKKKWRNALSKAERSGLTLEWDMEGIHLSWLLKVYALDKAQKNYDGPSVDLLHALAQNFAPGQKMIIGRALMDNKPVAAILILCHGSGATYQIGWSSQAGRNASAHNLLLWNLLTILKDKHITGLDLGGVNEAQSKGIQTFKSGMGGVPLSLPGIYS